MIKALDNKNNYVVKINDNIQKITNILEVNNCILESYNYDLEIYMINKNENFSKIKRISDIKECAVIKDTNGDRKIILKNDVDSQCKIYSIFFARELLYNLGYYELFYINTDIYSYKIVYNDKNICFKILDIKNQGCFIDVKNISSSELKNFLNYLKEIRINIESKNLKFDFLQEELNKVLYKNNKQKNKK